MNDSERKPPYRHPFILFRMVCKPNKRRIYICKKSDEHPSNKQNRSLNRSSRWYCFLDKKSFANNG